MFAGGAMAESPLKVEMELPLPEAGFELQKAVCSHGLFMMAPNRWDSSSRALIRPLRLPPPSHRLPPVVARITHHPDRPRSSLLVSLSAADPAVLASDHYRQAILGQVCRMLRLSDDDNHIISEFHLLHGQAQQMGFGRIFRSPTLFEDMVKCILFCNCQWPRTLSMAAALCEIQPELSCSSTLCNFQPRTPQPKEAKRKRQGKLKAKTNLVTLFSDIDVERQENLKIITHLNGEPSKNEEPLQENGIKAISTEPVEVKTDAVLCFPTPQELAAVDVDFLAMRCKLGYRAQRIVSLAQGIVEGKIQLKRFEDICNQQVPSPSMYEKLDEELSCVSGFGPFTRANILMCMGFFHRIPADTETIRHLKQIHHKKCVIGTVQKDLEAIYGAYAPFQFLAYWFELWSYYDEKFGKISEMKQSDYGLFTASKMGSKKITAL